MPAHHRRAHYALVLQAQLQEAAAEGAMSAFRDPDSPDTAKQRAADSVSAIALPSSAVSVTCPSSSTHVLVTIEYEHEPLGTFLPLIPDPMHMVTTSEADVLSTTVCTAAP